MAISHDRRGFALEATLGILILMSVLIVTVYASAMAAFRGGRTDYTKQRSYYAAEAGAESGMAQLADALEDAVLEDGEVSSITAPTMPGFVFDSFAVTKIDTVKAERITDGSFAGLYALTQLVDVYSEARAPDGSTSAVVVTAKAQAIPIFQFGVFYEKDLEIHNGPPMTFAGWVHTNGNLYLSSNSQYFEDLVTTPNEMYHHRKNSHTTLTGVYIHDASANDVQLNFDSRSTPDHSDFRNASDLAFDNRLKTNAYGVDSLTVPLPDGMDPVNVIERRLPGTDGALEIQAKMSWKADWYIEVPVNSMPNGSDFCTQYVSTRAAGKILPNAATCNLIFDLEYDQFRDGREGNFVDVLNIDMDELFAWAGTDSTRISEILYVHFTGTGPDPQSDGQYPAIRLFNAATLDHPITVASRHPIYVRGDYNSGAWQPAALIGDNVTYLSDNWNDANQQGSAVNNATSTTVYAAIMSGHSGTPCDHMDVGCSSPPYGGGLENFPRFLEDWGGETLFYRGSLVSLYFPQQSTGAWGGHYYNPPNRDWAFDLRFQDPQNLPPGTPVVGNVLHTAFRPVF